MASPQGVHVPEVRGGERGRVGDLPVASERVAALEQDGRPVELTLHRIEMGQTRARVGEAHGVIEGLGQPDAFLPEGDPFVELSQLGERLRQPRSSDHRRKFRIPHVPAIEVVVE